MGVEEVTKRNPAHPLFIVNSDGDRVAKVVAVGVPNVHYGDPCITITMEALVLKGREGDIVRRLGLEPKESDG